MSCVYGLLDPRSLEVRYVGKTHRVPESRLKEHIAYSLSGESHLARWIRKIDAVPSIVILEQDPEDLNEAERFWISNLRKQGIHLVNMTDGGDGMSKGTKLSLITRERISRAKIGNKFSLGHKNASRYRHSPEIIETLRESCTGRRHTEVSKEKIRKSKLGKPSHPQSEESRRKITESLYSTWAKRKAEH